MARFRKKPVVIEAAQVSVARRVVELLREATP